MIVELKVELEPNQAEAIAWRYNDDGRRAAWRMEPADAVLCKHALETMIEKALRECVDARVRAL